MAGPFKAASKNKQYLLVAVDHKTSWLSAKFTSKPTAEKVITFLNEYIAQNGIPKRIRTDPATFFRGELFKQFCTQYFISHIECPIRDHRGNGKIERLIRTINERIRAEKSILTEKRNAGINRLLFALRTTATTNSVSPLEKVFGQKPNTVKNLIIEKPKPCLENDKTLQLSPEEFPRDYDSTVFMRNKTRNTKLEGQFSKKKGNIVQETEHTVTMSTPRGRQVISKRDIVKVKKTKKRFLQPKEKATAREQSLPREKNRSFKRSSTKTKQPQQQKQRQTKGQHTNKLLTAKADEAKKVVPSPNRNTA